MTIPTLPESVEVVIIGGGIAGCSVAYHLMELGYKEVVLLERKQLTCGTTWHAAGLISQMRNSVNLCAMVQYSGTLYERLESETGLSTGFKRTGSLAVALTSERMHEFMRLATFAKYNNAVVEPISTTEMSKKAPGFDFEDAVGGVWMPRDGQADPVNITMALAKGAKNRGAKFFESVKVTGIEKQDGKVSRVLTNQGNIKTKIVINCAGIWSREVGKMAGVDVPLMPCEHYYIVTSNIDGLHKEMPSVRVPDQCGYYKEDAGKMLFGLFEPKAKPWGYNGIPDDFCFDQLPEDYDHFMPFLEKAIQRFPALEQVGIETFFNGPESFTPDDNFLIGEAPNVENFYVLAGFNSIGIQTAGGAGKYLAEWVKNRRPPCDLWEVDIRRMYPFQSNKNYLVDRVSETLGLLYADHFPYRQKITSRHLRRSPTHHLLLEHGACMGELSGWERANWFSPEKQNPQYHYSWWKQNWFDFSKQEHLALRNSVGLYDMSSFGKILIVGCDAADYLQYVCANDLEIEIGEIVYTQMLNQNACIEADVTVTRLTENSYLMVTGAANLIRDLFWLKRNKPKNCQCEFIDYTSAEGCLCLMGPNAQKMMERISEQDLSLSSFPKNNWQTLEIGFASARAHRMSYVGENGWELFLPTEMVAYALETLLSHGEDFGLKLVGLHAMDSARIEKGMRHFGHDITDSDHVLSAGLGFAVKAKKAPTKFGEFIGKKGLEKQPLAHLNKRLMQFKLQDANPMLYHNEVIYRDGNMTGYVTSGNYGHQVGSAIAMGYIECKEGETLESILSSNYEIEIACEKYQADISNRAFG